MKETIRQRALELGFDDCRFTTAKPPENSSHLSDWLRAGHHGEMTYLERNAAKRMNPRRILPGAHSIIVLAASYEKGDGFQVTSDADHAPLSRHPPRVNRHAFIARYARFTDYHDVLGARLKELTEFMNKAGGRESRSLWYVDTGPVMERDFAERAGIGFAGKHTNVISRKFGNWILLAEILTTLKIEPDAPEKNRCGSCTRCISACPTSAIIAPFQLDARLCISYLTIELKGPIPVELRPAISNRIFGCDACLAVCPWNRFARDGNLMKSHARPYLAVADLVELLQLDDAGFRAKFAGTPLARTKRRGLLRNVCVALGNVGNEKALPALRKAVTDVEPLIAEHANWAIEQIEVRLK